MAKEEEEEMGNICHISWKYPYEMQKQELYKGKQKFALTLLAKITSFWDGLLLKIIIKYLVYFEHVQTADTHMFYTGFWLNPVENVGKSFSGSFSNYLLVGY